MNNKDNLLLPAVIGSAALIICAIILAATWKSNYTSNQTINVTGSAKKDIISDLGVLRGTISAQAPTAEDAYRELSKMKPVLVSYLTSKGFPENKIEFYTINSYPVYEGWPNVIRSNARGVNIVSIRHSAFNPPRNHF